jgi:tetratricopeptide (TPR) repeat protein
VIPGPSTLPSRYQLLEVIGLGGMGRVYRAHDVTLGRDVAIKVLDHPPKDSTQQRERFVREAQATARLVHPNIVAVHDVDGDAGWLVMALIDGKTLRELPLPSPPDRVRSIALQVIDALIAAHGAGVVHRDIKPSNIMLDSMGHATLVDFGVARLLDGELTKTGESLGTPAYMAPEQMRGGTVDARSDLYGLGATLYELVTGEKMIAFESPNAKTLAKVRAACGDDDRLAMLIRRCLQADPADRPQTAKAARAALTDRARLGVKWLLAALVVAAIAAAIAFVTMRTTPVDPRLEEAFRTSQRGEHESAARVLEAYLAEHPDDADALTLRFLVTWWEGGVVEEAGKRASAARLSGAQRALVHGVGLIASRRETEAAGFLAGADKEHPDQVEIVFALGEAQWHARQYEEGVATLERAFQIDARWQMALHHVVEYRLSRGEAAKLEPIAQRLHAIDPSAADALACSIAIGKRDYAGAITLARHALARHATADLHICLSQALAILGDLFGGAVAANQAFELWPVDIREWGGLAHRAEYLLYRGKLDEYVSLLGQKPSRQRAIALSLWRPDPAALGSPAAFEVTPVGPGMRMPPLGAATFTLIGWAQDRDEVAAYAEYPETEVRELGKGLWAEKRGDPVAAIAHYRRALAAPQKGDIRMLISHALARTLHAQGDVAGATAACREVLEPTLYQAYRAVLLPDCVVWSGDETRRKQLVEAWAEATFEHPAVKAARSR